MPNKQGRPNKQGGWNFFPKSINGEALMIGEGGRLINKEEGNSIICKQFLHEFAKKNVSKHH